MRKNRTYHIVKERINRLYCITQQSFRNVLSTWNTDIIRSKAERRQRLRPRRKNRFLARSTSLSSFARDSFAMLRINGMPLPTRCCSLANLILSMTIITNGKTDRVKLVQASFHLTWLLFKPPAKYFPPTSESLFIMIVNTLSTCVRNNTIDVWY